ncbi:MAG: SagB/ThcOx family dehydrogenase [Candidatus Altiarchaeota archaeon]
MAEIFKLPKVYFDSKISVEKAIFSRRSVRKYSEEALTLEEISRILFFSQGITQNEFLRTAPSAGATYPLETYLVVGKVENLEHGVYHYIPEKHEIEKIFSGDVREKLADAALGQDFIAKAPASIIFTAIYERTTQRYGKRGIRYVHMEVGSASENVHLECESLGLGTVIVGAFYDEEVARLLNLNDEIPLCIMPIGRKI